MLLKQVTYPNRQADAVHCCLSQHLPFFLFLVFSFCHSNTSVLFIIEDLYEIKNDNITVDIQKQSNNDIKAKSDKNLNNNKDHTNEDN